MKMNHQGYYTVILYGFETEVYVFVYTPARPSGTLPESPPEKEEVDWEADSGDALLNYYINQDVDAQLSIEKQLLKQVHQRENDFVVEQHLDNQDMK